MLKDVDYFAHSLGRITCDGCDNLVCYGFVDHADDCGFLCGVCKRKKVIEQAPEVERQEFERMCRFWLEIECGGSKEGHDWVDITYSTFVMNARAFSCTKCPAQKTEPWKTTIFDPELSVVKPIKIVDEILGYKPWTKE